MQPGRIVSIEINCCNMSELPTHPSASGRLSVGMERGQLLVHSQAGRLEIVVWGEFKGLGAAAARIHKKPVQALGCGKGRGDERLEEEQEHAYRVPWVSGTVWCCLQSCRWMLCAQNNGDWKDIRDPPVPALQGRALRCASGIPVLAELCWMGMFWSGVLLARLPFHPDIF